MEKYGYDGLVHLIPEIDGVRVLSTYQHELIQKVPDVVQRIFRINSTDPGSFLVEASKQYQVPTSISFDICFASLSKALLKLMEFKLKTWLHWLIEGVIFFTLET